MEEDSGDEIDCNGRGAQTTYLERQVKLRSEAIIKIRHLDATLFYSIIGKKGLWQISFMLVEARESTEGFAGIAHLGRDQARQRSSSGYSWRPNKSGQPPCQIHPVPA